MLSLFPKGVILVYDISNCLSFDEIDKWIKEIDEVGAESVNQSIYCPL